MIRSIAVVFSGLLLAAVPVSAQTTAELLQKGIYAQETEGNLDNAILIYRQIVNSAPAQRNLAAQAQYRLAQALLQKGDLATASKEFERLARDYADYGSLVSSLAGQIRPSVRGGGRGGRGPAGAQATGNLPALQDQQRAAVAELQARLAELRTKYTDGHPDIVTAESQIEDLKKALARSGVAERTPQLWHADLSEPITIRGTVSKVQWITPRVVVDVPVTNANGTTTLWGFQLGAPNTLLKLGWVRTTLNPGDTVTFMGYLAQEDMGAPDVKYAVPTSATLADGRTLSGNSEQQ